MMNRIISNGGYLIKYLSERLTEEFKGEVKGEISKVEKRLKLEGSLLIRKYNFYEYKYQFTVQHTWGQSICWRKIRIETLENGLDRLFSRVVFKVKGRVLY